MIYHHCDNTPIKPRNLVRGLYKRPNIYAANKQLTSLKSCEHIMSSDDDDDEILYRAVTDFEHDAALFSDDGQDDFLYNAVEYFENGYFFSDLFYIYTIIIAIYIVRMA